MADESVVVELLLTASQFLSEAQKAAKAAEQIGAAGKKSSQEAMSGMDRMRQSAKENSAEWQTVGGHLLKVGAAQLAFGTAVAVTGGNYNRLQQTSRAALSSMLGGTKAANDQMDKLDAWATKSPFSRAVWIEAQQQLLAFGVEANKVIPYMDGIQNAVAAAGGSEAHLRGITEIMAKISSSSKITGQDLNQFGNWGVNAAELIGLAMGKTGAQIREEITAGTLDANVALDALAIGMSTKFAGAAASVKNTFDGAFDRVKAAFRDLSAEIMQPFIGQQGGGLFTDLLNQAADLMRAFQRLPGPVKDFVAAFGVATTAMSLGGGAVMSMVPKVLELHSSLKLLGSQGIPVISKFASSWASVPGHLSSAFADMRGGFASIGDSVTLASQMGVSKAQAMRVGMGSAFSALGSSAKSAGSALLGAFGGGWGLAATAAITGVTMAVMQFSRRSQEARQRARELADTFDETTGQMTQATRAYAADQFVKFANDLKQVGSSAREATDAYMQGLPAYDAYIDRTLEAAAASGMSAHYQARLGDHLRDRRQDLANATEYTREHADAMGEESGAADELTGALDETADSAQAAAEAEQAAADAAKAVQEAYEMQLDALKAVNDYRDRMSSAANAALAAERDWINAQKELNEQIEKNGTTLDQNTEAGQKNMKAWQDLVSAGVEYVSTSVQAGESSEISAAKFAEADAAISGFADQLGITSEEALETAHNLGWLTDQDYEVLLSMYVEGENEVAAAEDQLQGIPRETWAKITAETNAPEIVDTVNQALAEGIPAETITKLFAENETQAAAAEAEQMVNGVRQRKAARIEAINRANDPAREAQVVIDGVKQGAPAEIKAVDKASGILSHIKWGLDLITSKTITVTTQHVATGAGGNSAMRPVGRAFGGAVFGPGGPRDDLIPAWLSNDEHVVAAPEIKGIGGHQNMEALRYMMRSTPEQLRDALGFADGGSPASVAAPRYFAPRSPAPVVNVAAQDLDGLRLVGELRVNGQEATATDLRLERIARGWTRIGDEARMHGH